MSDDRLFERANAAADLEKIAGVPLFRAGRRMRGECPLCGASKGKKSGGAFSIDVAAKRWTCWACGEKGDAADLAAKLWGMTPKDAAEQLAGPAPAGLPPRRVSDLPARPQKPARPDDSEAWAANMAVELWAGGQPATGTLVETYLRSRGLFGPVLQLALMRLRFHPNAYHSGPRDRALRFPAMVAIVHAPGGATGGVHVTYLAADGRGKAAVDPAKKMVGPQARDGKPGGVWLASPSGPGGLVVAEGIESALSAAILLGGPRRVVAALSLGRLQGGQLVDRYGRRDVDLPRPDPDSPAFTWPQPSAAPWGDVVVAVDLDMRPVKVKARKALGGTFDRQLDAAGRARLCAGLAEGHWRAAGANAVRSIAPGDGRDFNDELQARIAAGDVMVTA
jgi:hypothetical protein